jgi:hypothetical protein
MILLHTLLSGYTLSYVCMEGFIVHSSVGFLACIILVLFVSALGFIQKLITEILKPEYNPATKHQNMSTNSNLIKKGTRRLDSPKMSILALILRALVLLTFVLLIVGEGLREYSYI